MIGPLRLRSALGGGAATRILTHEFSVSLRRPRPHENVPAAPPGFRVIVATAYTLDGPEDAAWAVPRRQAGQALNPKNKAPSRELAAGRVPDGWQRL